MSPVDVAALRAAVPVRDLAASDAARSRLRALTSAPPALGRLEGLATWLCGVQGACPPRPLHRVRVLVFAGTHRLATGHGPRADELSAATLRGTDAPVSVLARLQGASVRVLDPGGGAASDQPPDGEPSERGPADDEQALSAAELVTAFEAGQAIADEEVDAGVDLLVASSAGVTGRPMAAVLVGAALGLEALDVVGTGAGLDDATWAARVSAVRDGLFRARGQGHEPLALLRTVGSADTAALTGFLVQAAVRRTPVLLDGALSCACALLARQVAEGAAQWWLAADRTSDAAQQRALAALDLEPLLDLGLDLDDGTGALVALTLLRAAQLLLAETATFDPPQLTAHVDDDAT